MNEETKIYQFEDSEGNKVAPLVPEKAVVDKDGVRLSDKLEALNVETIKQQINTAKDQAISEVEASSENLTKNVGLDEYETFSEAKEYPAGYTLMKDGLLYTFKVDHVAGAWDESEVEDGSLKGEMNVLGNFSYIPFPDIIASSLFRELYIDKGDYIGELFLRQVGRNFSTAEGNKWQIQIFDGQDLSNGQVLLYRDTTFEETPEVLFEGTISGSVIKVYAIVNWDIITNGSNTFINKGNGAKISNIAYNIENSPYLSSIEYKNKVILLDEYVGEKDYNPEEYSGLAKVYLPKNDGYLVQRLLNDSNGVPRENTNFIIRYDYDSKWGDIEIGKGCKFTFDGGSINNVKIKTNGCLVDNLTYGDIIIKDLPFIPESLTEGIINVFYLGIKPNTTRDYSEILNNILNNSESKDFYNSKELYFTSGEYNFKSPLNIDIPYLSIRGTMSAAFLAYGGTIFNIDFVNQPYNTYTFIKPLQRIQSISYIYFKCTSIDFVLDRTKILDGVDVADADENGWIVTNSGPNVICLDGTSPATIANVFDCQFTGFNETAIRCQYSMIRECFFHACNNCVEAISDNYIINCTASTINTFCNKDQSLNTFDNISLDSVRVACFSDTNQNSRYSNIRVDWATCNVFNVTQRPIRNQGLNLSNLIGRATIQRSMINTDDVDSYGTDKNTAIISTDRDGDTYISATLDLNKFYPGDGRDDLIIKPIAFHCKHIMVNKGILSIFTDMFTIKDLLEDFSLFKYIIYCTSDGQYTGTIILNGTIIYVKDLTIDNYDKYHISLKPFEILKNDSFSLLNYPPLWFRDALEFYYNPSLKNITNDEIYIETKNNTYLLEDLSANLKCLNCYSLDSISSGIDGYFKTFDYWTNNTQGEVEVISPTKIRCNKTEMLSYNFQLKNDDTDIFANKKIILKATKSCDFRYIIKYDGTSDTIVVNETLEPNVSKEIIIPSYPQEAIGLNPSGYICFFLQTGEETIIEMLPEHLNSICFNGVSYGEVKGSFSKTGTIIVEGNISTSVNDNEIIISKDAVGWFKKLMKFNRELTDDEINWIKEKYSFSE